MFEKAVAQQKSPDFDEKTKESMQTDFNSRLLTLVKTHLDKPNHPVGSVLNKFDDAFTKEY